MFGEVTIGFPSTKTYIFGDLNLPKALEDNHENSVLVRCSQGSDILILLT